MGSLGDVGKVHRIAERILVEFRDPIEAPLPTPQLLDIGREGYSPKVTVLVHQVANPIVEPLTSVPIRHVNSREQAHAVKVDSLENGGE
jgi:hypothetical protein